MGQRWLSQMLYAQRSRHGIWKYRRAIPEALRPSAGKREINISLGTKDEHEAQLAYVGFHGKVEAYLQGLTRLARDPNSTNNDRDLWDLGQAFLRSRRIPYVPLADLRAQEAFDDGPSQLEQRLEAVADLGIDVDDPRVRDREINESWKAKALLGDLNKPQFCMSDALRVYFDQRKPELSVMSPKQAKRYRLNKESVVNSLKHALGADKPHASLTRTDARCLRDYFRGKGLAVPTVNKHVGTIATIWKVAAQDQDVALPSAVWTSAMSI